MILPYLFIARTENKGWGVFTKQSIQADLLIESSPVIIMSAQEMELLNKTKLHDYIFHWENEKCCMAMGYVPLYNHEKPSNCEYFQNFENGIIEIKSMRTIDAGEELTINYQGSMNAPNPDWFELKP